MVNVIRFDGEAFNPIQTLRTSALDRTALNSARGIKQAEDEISRSMERLKRPAASPNSRLADAANARAEAATDSIPTPLDTVRNQNASAQATAQVRAANFAQIRGDGPDYVGLTLDVTA